MKADLLSGLLPSVWSRSRCSCLLLQVSPLCLLATTLCPPGRALAEWQALLHQGTDVGQLRDGFRDELQRLAPSALQGWLHRCLCRTIPRRWSRGAW